MKIRSACKISLIIVITISLLSWPVTAIDGSEDNTTGSDINVSAGASFEIESFDDSNITGSSESPELIVQQEILEAAHAPQTITVGPSGWDYTRINDAIDNATDGDTIIVMSGNYPETIVVDKSLTIRGNDTGGGIPVMSYQEASYVPVTIDSEYVTFENFRILSTGNSAVSVLSNNSIVRNITATGQKPDSSDIPAINIAENLSSVTVSDCSIETEGGYGIYFKDTKDVLIENNVVNVNSSVDDQIEAIYGEYSVDKEVFSGITVRDNRISGGPIEIGVLYLHKNQPHPVLKNILVENNTLSDGATSGIEVYGRSNIIDEKYIYDCINVTLADNTVSNWGISSGIRVEWANGGLISGNVVENGVDGMSGLRLEEADGFEVSDNIVKNCELRNDFSKGGLSLEEVTNSVISGNILTNVNPYSFNYGPGGDMLPNLIFDETNTADGKPVLYYEGKSGVKVDNSDPAMVVMMSCSDIEITNSNIKGSMLGAGIYNSSDILITGNSINDSYYGIMLINSENSVIKGNTFYEDFTGLGVGTNLNADISENTFLYSLEDGVLVHTGSSYNISISKNSIYGRFNGLDQGITVADAIGEGVTISNNFINHSARGLLVYFATDLIVEDNNIEDCGAGFALDAAQDNSFKSNTIISSDDDYTGMDLFDNISVGGGLCNDNLFYNNYVKSATPLVITTKSEGYDSGVGGEYGAVWGPDIGTPDIITFEGAESSWNQWNITKTTGTNIVGGPYLGGNYWATPDGTGWSQTHPDRGDGFCSEPFAYNINNTDSLPLHTGAKPAANFTASPVSGYSPLTVSFTDLSTGDITGFEWSFGDGQTSTEESPVHVYSSAGAYSVTLTVTGPGGSDAMALTDYILVSSRSSGGGSGGGNSGSSVSVFSGSGSLITSSDGKVLKSVQVDADDGVGEIVIPKGTYALNEDGDPLSEVSITPKDTVSSDVSLPGGFSFTGYACECAPSGAVFSPSAELVFTFSDNEWAELMAGNEPLVLYYVGTDGTTEEIPVVIDEAGRTVTAAVTHFSTYYLMHTESSGSQVEVTSVPTETQTVPETPTSGSTQSPTAESSGFSAFVLLISVITLAFAGFYLRRQK